MIETIGAKIFFGILILLQIGLITGISIKVYNRKWIALACISAVISGFLLYFQIWSIYFWYVLITGALSPFMPKKAMFDIPFTFPKYILTVAFLYLTGYGTYGIIYVLNK